MWGVLAAYLFISIFAPLRAYQGGVFHVALIPKYDFLVSPYTDQTFTLKTIENDQNTRIWYFPSSGACSPVYDTTDPDYTYDTTTGQFTTTKAGEYLQEITAMCHVPGQYSFRVSLAGGAQLAMFIMRVVTPRSSIYWSLYNDNGYYVGESAFIAHLGTEFSLILTAFQGDGTEYEFKHVIDSLYDENGVAKFDQKLQESLYKFGVFPAVVFPGLRILVPTSSVEWDPEHFYWRVKVLAVAPARSFIQVNSIELDGGVVQNTDFGFSVTPFSIRSADDSFSDSEKELISQAALPLFFNPTRSDTTDSLLRTICNYDPIVVPEYMTLFKITCTDPDLDQRYFRAGLAEPSNMMAVHLTPRDFFLDQSDTSPDVAQPYDDFVVMENAVCVRIEDVVYAYVHPDEIRYAVKQFNLAKRIGQYREDMLLPGDEGYEGTLFTPIQANIHGVVGGTPAAVYDTLSPTPDDLQTLSLERQKRFERMTFQFYSIQDGVLRLAHISYFHILASIILSAADPTSSEIPDISTLEAIPAVVATPFPMTYAGAQMAWYFSPQYSPSFLFVAALYSEPNPGERHCQVSFTRHIASPLNTSLYASRDDVKYNDELTVIDLTDPEMIPLCQGARPISFGRTYPDFLVVSTRQAYKVSLLGEIEICTLKHIFEPNNYSVNAFPSDPNESAEDSFTMATNIASGVILAQTRKGGGFLFTSMMTDALEIMWTGDSSSVPIRSTAWGGLGHSISPPESGSETGRNQMYYLDVISGIVSGILSFIHDECRLSSLQYTGESSAIMDRGSTTEIAMSLQAREGEIAGIVSFSAPIVNQQYSLIRYHLQPTNNQSKSTDTIGYARDTTTITTDNGVTTMKTSIELLPSMPEATAMTIFMSPNAVPQCIASAAIISDVIGPISSGVTLMKSDNWENWPLGALPQTEQLAHVLASEILTSSPFSLIKGLSFSTTCSTNRRISNSDVSFDPADCPKYAPNSDGSMKKISLPFWMKAPFYGDKDLINGKTVNYDFHRLGCPVTVRVEDEVYVPNITLFEGGISHSIEDEHVVSELLGRTDYSYSLSEKDACISAPMTWWAAEEKAKEVYADRMFDLPDGHNCWNPAVHRSCLEPGDDDSKPGRSPLQVLGMKSKSGESNGLMFPPSSSGGIFVFRVRVVDGTASYCDLYTDFAVEVIGANTPYQVALIILFSAAILLLIIILIIYPIWNKRNPPVKVDDED